jgi:hypothetical protein
MRRLATAGDRAAVRVAGRQVIVSALEADGGATEAPGSFLECPNGFSKLP